ncbi:MAG: hypothetical protein GY765_21665, partial [bacterium]|nr:hypothetical protein [bacterium]
HQRVGKQQCILYNITGLEKPEICVITSHPHAWGGFLIFSRDAESINGLSLFGFAREAAFSPRVAGTSGLGLHISAV